MKKLHTFHIWECPQAGMYKEMLSKEGIECLIKNDRLSSAIGEIPFTECFPELWVIDEEIYPRARLLLDGWLAQPVDGDETAWICKNCGEEVSPQFAVCWKCSRSHD